MTTTDKTTPQVAGRFSKFRDAPTMGVRNWIPPGHHVLLARRFEMSASKNPLHEGQQKCVIEYKVLQTDSDKIKPGDIVSFVEMSWNQGYYGNVKEVTAGMLGMKIADMEKDPDFDRIFDFVWGEQQILVNHVVRCSAQQVRTTKGGDYTAKSWDALPARLYAEYGLIAPEGAYDDSAPSSEQKTG